MMVGLLLLTMINDDGSTNRGTRTDVSAPGLSRLSGAYGALMGR